jgi:5-formyltetrahydrofolate cyclo-ligase
MPAPDDGLAPKDAQRRAAERARRKLPVTARQAADVHIARAAGALLATQGARTVGLYAALGAEVGTAALHEALRARGVVVAYPVVAPHAAPMRFARVDVAATLVRGPYGVPAPRDGSPEVRPEELDAVVVPLVAFDEACQRIGRGRGHYDRTLPALSCVTIGLAYEAQRVGAVAADPWDVRLDAIVTERQTYQCPR